MPTKLQQFMLDNPRWKPSTKEFTPEPKIKACQDVTYFKPGLGDYTVPGPEIAVKPLVAVPCDPDELLEAMDIQYSDEMLSDLYEKIVIEMACDPRTIEEPADKLDVIANPYYYGKNAPFDCFPNLLGVPDGGFGILAMLIRAMAEIDKSQDANELVVAVNRFDSFVEQVISGASEAWANKLEPGKLYRLYVQPLRYIVRASDAGVSEDNAERAQALLPLFLEMQSYPDDDLDHPFYRDGMTGEIDMAKSELVYIKDEENDPGLIDPEVLSIIEDIKAENGANEGFNSDTQEDCTIRRATGEVPDVAGYMRKMVARASAFFRKGQRLEQSHMRLNRITAWKRNIIRPIHNPRVYNYVKKVFGGEYVSTILQLEDEDLVGYDKVSVSDEIQSDFRPTPDCKRIRSALFKGKNKAQQRSFQIYADWNAFGAKFDGVAETCFSKSKEARDYEEALRIQAMGGKEGYAWRNVLSAVIHQKGSANARDILNILQDNFNAGSNSEIEIQVIKDLRSRISDADQQEQLENIIRELFVVPEAVDLLHCWLDVEDLDEDHLYSIKTVGPTWRNLGEYFEQYGDDVLDARPFESLRVTNTREIEIDAYCKQTIQKIALTGSTERQTIIKVVDPTPDGDIVREVVMKGTNTPGYIAEYLNTAVTATRLKDEKGNDLCMQSGFAGMRASYSPEAREAFAQAKKSGKDNKGAMAAFWAVANPPVPVAKPSIVNLPKTGTGLLLSSGRLINWHVAALKVKGNELDLDNAGKAKLKGMLEKLGWGKELIAVL